MKVLFGICAAALVVVCAGCIPYRFVGTTGASGRIVDAQSGAAVGQAKIVVSESGPGRNVQTVIYSSTDGTFYITPCHKWGVLPLGPLDPLSWFTTIDISAPSYTTFSQAFRCTTIGPGTIKLPDVKLQHKQ